MLQELIIHHLRAFREYIGVKSLLKCVVSLWNLREQFMHQMDLIILFVPYHVNKTTVLHVDKGRSMLLDVLFQKSWNEDPLSATVKIAENSFQLLLMPLPRHLEKGEA